MLEPSGHTHYYGLVYGGGDLAESSQNDLYFLVGQNGSYILMHRANDVVVHDIMGRTMHDAVAMPDDNGQSTNHPEVRVGADEIEYVINGTVVHTTENSGVRGHHG